MSSSSAQSRQRLASEINKHGRLAEIPCDRCFNFNLENPEKKWRVCIAMEKSSRGRCSECTKLGRSCVNLSWSTLDKTREEYEKKVDADEEELCRVMARYMRNKRILRQANKRAERKALCLERELEETGELDDTADCPAADATVNLSPAVWQMMGFVNDAVGITSSESGTAVKAGSSS